MLRVDGRFSTWKDKGAESVVQWQEVVHFVCASMWVETCFLLPSMACCSF